MATTVYSEAVAKRFWSKVDTGGGDDSCWAWTAGKTPRGYGHMKVNGKAIYAHRIAWELSFGDIPHGIHVCHRCDNPSCCNVRHLFLGSAADNAADRDAKGRGAAVNGSGHVLTVLHGSDNPMAKLHERDVVRIVDMYRSGSFTQRDLARMFGVHQSIVSEIINGKRWKHITGGER